jgi:isocitrate dehydrogenase
MMKVSDPIIFGHAVEVFFADVFEKHGDASPLPASTRNDGLGDVLAAIEDSRRPARRGRGRHRRAIEAGAGAGDGRLRPGHHQPARAERRHHRRVDAGDDPRLGPDVEPRRRAAGHQGVIPDSSYAGVYQAVIDDCKANGAFDPRRWAAVPNVGLMAQKAEEYGSHDKTFEIPGRHVRVVDEAGGDVLDGAPVERGDIWRMCQVKDAAIRDWVKLAVTAPAPPARRRCSGSTRPGPTTPSSSPRCAATWATTTPTASTIEIMAPVRGHAFSLERIRRGETRSRSPATCCATTSPTCSRSSSSAPAPRCCRSCRS